MTHAVNKKVNLDSNLDCIQQKLTETDRNVEKWTEMERNGKKHTETDRNG